MPTGIPARRLALADAIAVRGNVSLTRLTIVKRWFDRPARLAAFAIWMVAGNLSEEGRSRNGASSH